MNIQWCQWYVFWQFLPDIKYRNSLKRFSCSNQAAPQTNAWHRIFAYGTLKRGQPNHWHFQSKSHGETMFIGMGRTDLAYPLVIGTEWNLPFLLFAPGQGQVIYLISISIDSEWNFLLNVTLFSCIIVVRCCWCRSVH